MQHNNIASIVPLIAIFCIFKFPEWLKSYIFKVFIICTFSRVTFIFNVSSDLYTFENNLFLVFVGWKSDKYDSEVTVVVSTFLKLFLSSYKLF